MNSIDYVISVLNDRFEDFSVQLTGERVLSIIAISRAQMKTGEITEQQFLKLREVLLAAVEPANGFVQ